MHQGVSSYHWVSGVGKADTFTCNLNDFWPAVTSITGPFLWFRLMNGFSGKKKKKKKRERYSDRYMKKLCLQGWRFLKAWRDLLRKSSEYQTLARCRLERWRWQVCEWRLLCRGRQLKVSLDSQQLLRIQTVTRSLVKTSLEISTETSEITPLMFIYAAQYLQFTVLPIIC